MNTPGLKKRVCLFGNFGRYNLGNECTLQAMIYNVRRFLPDTELSCVCTDPEDTSARHNVPAYPISGRMARVFNPPISARRGNFLMRLICRVLIRVPMEICEWVKAYRTLRGAGMLVMTGTGMLGDFGISPFGLHYEILKWSIVAKLHRWKLLFVSVGAGPIDHPLSRFFVKAALWLADYRSYRDAFSGKFLESIGFKASKDPIFPDLAFSLPGSLLPGCRNPGRQRPLIGIGLMEYYGRGCDSKRGEGIYLDYIGKLATFVAWLLDHEYTVRLLIGDVLYDSRVQRDMLELLEKRGANCKNRVVYEPVSTFEELLSQFAATDRVVCTRFHNVLLALMLNKPVVSIAYHDKNDLLMAEMGLAEYCQHIDHLDVDRLIGQFTTLGKNAQRLKPQIKQKTEAYGKALDAQYARIFNVGLPAVEINKQKERWG